VRKRFSREVRRARVARSAARKFGRLPEPVRAIRGCGGLPAGVPELERALEMVQRGRGSDFLGCVGSHEQRRERSDVIPGPVEMKGQLGGSIGAGKYVWWLVSQYVGDAAMKPFAFRRQKLVVHDLADQRMTKAIGVGLAIDNDELRVDRSVERYFEPARVHFRNLHQNVVGRVMPNDGDDADDQPADEVEIFKLAGDEI
jgi:hypothetical protein